MGLTCPQINMSKILTFSYHTVVTQDIYYINICCINYRVIFRHLAL